MPLVNNYDEPARFADLVRSIIRDELYKLFGGMVSPFVTGVVVQAEVEDANLTQVILPGDGTTIARYVPKLASASFSAGQTVLMVRANNVPLTIIGRLSGDITVAEVSEE